MKNKLRYIPIVLIFVLLTVGFASPKYKVEITANMDIANIDLDIINKTVTVRMMGDTVSIYFRKPLKSAKITSLCVELEAECGRLLKKQGVIND